MNTTMIFFCTECGGESKKFHGQCPHCQAWNTLTEAPAPPKKSKSAALRTHYAGAASETPKLLSEIQGETTARHPSGIRELDRVLGGGLVQGSVVLLGGDPGIGKSTLLLQLAAHSPEEILYITGEESLSQLKLRAERLSLPTQTLWALAHTEISRIIDILVEKNPKLVIIDSIQTMHDEAISSASGSVSQVKECTARLVQYAKQHNTTIFLVGHVTKEGALAGPRVLEHMVDTVLYFEGDQGSRFRLIRAVKNRFGAVNELAIFAMSDKGLKEVSQPSAIFLNQERSGKPGSVIFVSLEGTRPLLVEIQALAEKSYSDMPRRIAIGIEQQRLSLLLAIMSKHIGVSTYDKDVFINVVGGLRLDEPGTDMAVILAILSSLKNKALPSGIAVFGEVGLGGEIRPIQNGVDRVKEAQKHGFTTIVLPKGNMPKAAESGITFHALSEVKSVIELFFT